MWCWVWSSAGGNTACDRLKSGLALVMVAESRGSQGRQNEAQFNLQHENQFICHPGHFYPEVCLHLFSLRLDVIRLHLHFPASSATQSGFLYRQGWGGGLRRLDMTPRIVSRVQQPFPCFEKHFDETECTVTVKETYLLVYLVSLLLSPMLYAANFMGH